MGVTERKEREREQRREDILNAAEKVFFKLGVDRATMDDVAHQAELSKATLYLYFSSKEEIYFAIFLRGQKILAGMIEHATGLAVGTREKLQAYLSSVIAFQKKYPKYFDAFFYFLTRGVQISDLSIYKKEHAESSRILLNNWISLVQTGKEEKLIRENLNGLQSGAILWMQLIGFLKIYPVLKREYKSKFSLSDEEVISNYAELIFSGMMKK
jgi:AcrR family transcriptional regulator